MLSRSLLCPLSTSCLMGHSDVLLRQVQGRDILIISSFSNLYLKETKWASTFQSPYCMSVSLPVKGVNKLNGTHNLPAACRHVFFLLGVFQMGERYQAYHSCYWLFHLPDQILFPILAPSQSADFVVSSSGTAILSIPWTLPPCLPFC